MRALCARGHSRYPAVGISKVGVPGQREEAQVQRCAASPSPWRASSRFKHEGCVFAGLAGLVASHCVATRRYIPLRSGVNRAQRGKVTAAARGRAVGDGRRGGGGGGEGPPLHPPPSPTPRGEPRFKKRSARHAALRSGDVPLPDDCIRELATFRDNDTRRRVRVTE